MTSTLSLGTGAPLSQNLLLGQVQNIVAGPSSTGSSNVLKMNPCIYIASETSYDKEITQVVACFQKSKIFAEEKNPSAATHFVLFVTDTLLKTKEYIYPLIQRFNADPHFKQRIFPFIMPDRPLSIFAPGDEQAYTEYWNKERIKFNTLSAEYYNAKEIEESIAGLIRSIRDTLMPSLISLIKADFASVITTIQNRPHLLEVKRFFFLPKEGTSHFFGRKAELNELTRLFAEKNKVLISGEMRVGKTVLAIEYARCSQKYASGIFWLDGSTKESLEKSFEHLENQLSMTSQEAKAELHNSLDYLLIYDNVMDPSLIEPLIPSANSLILGANLANSDLVLGNFSNEEALEIVREQLNVSEADAQILARLIANHPSKLCEAVAFIRSCKITIRDYLNFYLTDQENLLEKQRKARLGKEASLPLHPPLPFDLEPSPQVLQKYQNMSIAGLSQEFKDEELEIFISYCWKPTKEPVNRIDATLKNLGIELLRDEKELRDFDSLREFMKKVIRKADYTLSIINDNYLKSFNCLFEIVMTCQDLNWKGRVFPIILPGTDIYTDLAISRYQKHWEQEAANLERTLGTSAPEVAIAKEAARKIGPFLQFAKQVDPSSIEIHLMTTFKETLALMLARQEKLDKKGIFHLPMGRNKNFTGRDSEMAILKDSLKKGQYSAITNAGMGGVGKTHLALEYVYRNLKEYTMVYWVRAESLKADYRLLGQEIGISEDFLKDEKVISTMKGVLENRKGWLLVFDNAENLASIKEALPQEGGHILITSRDPNWDSKVSLQVFDPEEALVYLHKISGITGQEKELNFLAEELGYLPLALTQAGAYIKQQNIDVARYLSEYKTKEKQFLSQREKGYPGSVATAWFMSMEKIKLENPYAIEILNFCSYLAPENIPARVLERWLNEKNQKDSKLDFHEALRVLESYSLIDQKLVEEFKITKKFISIHRLTQAVNRNECENEKTLFTINLGIKVLSQQLEIDKFTKENLDTAEALIPHSMSLVNHAEEQNIISERLAILAFKVGYHCLEACNLLEAKKYHEKSLNIKKNFYKTESHFSVAISYMNLGCVLKDQGELVEAIKFYEMANQIYLESLKTEDDLSVAENYMNLGIALAIQGDLKKAAKQHEKASEINAKCLGTEKHLNVAKNLNNRGLVLTQLAMHKDAVKCYEDALEIFIAHHKTDEHIHIALTCLNLGTAYLQIGDYDQAKKYLEKSLKINLNYYGNKNHLSVALNYNNLGNLFNDQGLLEEAREHYSKALKINTTVLKTENHLNVALNYVNLGNVQKKAGDLRGALLLHEKALRIKRSFFASEMNLSVGESYLNIGAAYLDLGDLNQAKNNNDQALRVFKFFYANENHPFLAAGHLNEGVILYNNGNLQEAKSSIEKALDINKKHYGSEKHTSVSECYNGLGCIFLDLKELQIAKQYFEKALNTNLSIFQDKLHVSIANNYNNLGSVARKQRELKIAKTHYEKAIEVFKICLGTENHTSVAQSYNNLGGVLKDAGELKSAKEFCEKALSIYLQFFTTHNHLDLALTYYNLGYINIDLGDFKAAKENFIDEQKVYKKCFATEGHPYVAKNYDKLGDICLILKEKAEAKNYFINAKRVYQKLEGNQVNIYFDDKIKSCEDEKCVIS